MKTGDIVRIKEEWDGGPDLFVIVEWNGDRGFISPVKWDMKLVPRELVREHMIELATDAAS